MKRSITLLLAALSFAARTSADTTPARIPFGSEAARPHVTAALALADAMAPNAAIRAEAEKAIAADADSAIAYYLVGTTYGGDEAKAPLEKAVALAAKSSEGERLFLEAALLQRSHKDLEAIAAFKKLQEKWPGEPLVAVSLGDLYQGIGKLEDARQAGETATKLAPTSPRAHALLGGTLLHKEDYARARTEFETARAHLAEGATPGSVWFGIATSYVYEGRSKQAIETLRAFLEAYRKAGAGASFPEVFILNATARIQLESGDAKSAIETYAQGFESVKKSNLSEHDKKIWEGRLHHGRGRSLARMGKPKEAWAEAEIVKSMIDAGGEDGKEFIPAYHYLAGYLKLEAGETAKAIEELKLAQANDDPFRALLLARAYDKAGQKDNALATYQKIVETKRNSLERALSYPEAKRKMQAAGIKQALAGGLWRVLWGQRRTGDMASTPFDLHHGTVAVLRGVGPLTTLSDDCVLFDRPMVNAGAYFAACGDRSPVLLVKRYEGGEGFDEKWKLDENGLYRTLNGKPERITLEEAKRLGMTGAPFRAAWDEGVKFPARSADLKTETGETAAHAQ